MAVEVGSVDHLSQVISHAVAPSFLLAAVAGFVTVLFTRMTNILDRVRNLHVIPDEGHDRSFLKADIPRLKRRAKLVNNAILLSICSGIVAAILIIFAFASVYLGLEHVWGAAVLFMVALGLLASSLVVFAIEVSISLTNYDHH